MEQHTKKLFIFDFDGVISDSLTVYIKIYNEIYHKYNLPEVKTKADVRKLFDKNVTQTLSQIGLTQEQITKYLTEFKEISIARQNEFAPFDGIKEAISALAQYNILSIISTNHVDVINSFLEKHAFPTVFRDIIGAEGKMTKIEKIRTIIEKESANPGHTYYIGDTLGDIVEGKEAGVKTVAVTWGYYEKEAIMEGSPDFLFESPNQLTTLIGS